MRRFAIALAPLLLAACSAAPQPAGASPAYPYQPGAITVSAGENFYGELLHDLGGADLKVYAFLSDPNADPHHYESSPAIARAVADSRLVIENGAGYDPFLDRLLRASPRPGRVVIDVSRLVGAPPGANPHLWYDPAVMPKVAAEAAAALASLDPAHAASYQAGLERYRASTAAIATRVAELRTRFGGAPIAMTEPVFAYMADALGLQVLTPDAFMKAVEEGNDPPTQAAARQEDLVRGHLVRALVYNSQTVTRVTSRLKDLAVGSGVPVVGVSETQPPGRTYAAWQLGQLDELAAALGGGS